MSWLDAHRLSERAAEAAFLAGRDGAAEQAASLYEQAAGHEEEALEHLDSNSPRTVGVLAISAVALWHKSGNHRRAIALAIRLEREAVLPAFARREIQALAVSAWLETVQDDTAPALDPRAVSEEDAAADGCMTLSPSRTATLFDKIEHLSALIDAAERLAAGEALANVPGVERGDELGRLARALETLKARLEVAREPPLQATVWAPLQRHG